MKNKHIKVSTRLRIGFGVILAMLAVVIGLAVHHLGTLNAGTNAIVAQSYPKVLEAQNLMNINNKIARSLRNALLIRDEAKAQAELAVVADKLKEMVASAQKLDVMVNSGVGQSLFDALQAAYPPYAASIAEVIRLRGDDGVDKAVEFMLTNTRDLQMTYMKRLDAVIAHQSDAMEKARANAEETYHNSRNMMLVLGLAALGLGVGGAWLISRQLLRQLGGEPAYVAGIAARIADGDLAVAIALPRGDAHSLLFAIQSMRDSLADIVRQVRGGADSIVTAATEIASGNQDLSSRTEQQAGSLEETASSMEELTATVKQNTENARQANTMARSASDIAVEGGAVVANVVNTMAEINDSARKVVDIISVIDGIAFQTNILALNAAVEAARAGEQGRGFAVVASEVRTLAHRSASAAKEIKLLIDDSVGKVGTGTQLVGEAGATMERIVGAVKSVTDIMGQISLASQEQEAGIAQINHAIAEMDTVTQQNAALVEEAAAAAEAQQDQAQQLSQLVGVFKLAPAQHKAPAARPDAKRPPALPHPAYAPHAA
ncbi:methyl-accepting chemotaxis protein [Duganella sp. 1411]|uniref:methyl-accepting chemotaxis protein n=1 Tax=Duganella sp. 1411 TaxID=2806572 RepID=UPI001AE7AE2A|nr:methyl-accepting chemotaxis protein [Duganella sp. 1411]MBP1205321.1 methyl-accepting chemotaxis protein [Duganella sp. 1411]